jgi:isocitrate/isopropylmalate dehydrogenase
MTLKIALLAGDGIGPEILVEAVRVLDVLRGEGCRSRPRRRSSGVRLTTIAASRCRSPRSIS